MVPARRFDYLSNIEQTLTSAPNSIQSADPPYNSENLHQGVCGGFRGLLIARRDVAHRGGNRFVAQLLFHQARFTLAETR